MLAGFVMVLAVGDVAMAAEPERPAGAATTCFDPAALPRDTPEHAVAAELAAMDARRNGTPRCGEADATTVGGEVMFFGGGSIDHTRESRAIQAMLPAIRACHARARRLDPDLAGTWILAFNLPDVAETDVYGVGVPQDPRWVRPYARRLPADAPWAPPPEPLSTCVLDAVRAAAMPAPLVYVREGVTRGETVVRVPLRFGVDTRDDEASAASGR